MSTVLHPVGPQRARVYWVRRLLVVLLALGLVAVAATVVQALRADDAPAATAAAGTSEVTAAGTGTSGAPAAGAVGPQDEAEDEEPAPSTPVDCVPAAVQLTLTSSDVQFAAGARPVLTATVTNVGDEPCTVDAGDASREIVVSSGDDRVWSTKDCASEDAASRQLLLGAGAADTVEIEWPRVRSADGCPADLPAPQPGTYQAVATLGAASSQNVVFVLE